MSLKSSPNPSSGQTITFTAHVSTDDNTVAPTGPVQFTDVTLNHDLGHASLQLGTAEVSTALEVGTHDIEAYYGGDINYPSASATVIQVVQPPSTSAKRPADAAPSPVRRGKGPGAGQHARNRNLLR